MARLLSVAWRRALGAGAPVPASRTSPASRLMRESTPRGAAASVKVLSQSVDWRACQSHWATMASAASRAAEAISMPTLPSAVTDTASAPMATVTPRTTRKSWAGGRPARRRITG